MKIQKVSNNKRIRRTSKKMSFERSAKLSSERERREAERARTALANKFAREELNAAIFNFGPQHPSTHGVLRLISILHGEIIQ